MRTYTGSGTGSVATMVTTSSMCKCAAVLMHAQQLLPLVLVSPSSAFVTSPPAGRAMPSPMTHRSSKATTTIMTMARDMKGCGESAAWRALLLRLYGTVVSSLIGLRCCGVSHIWPDGVWIHGTPTTTAVPV